MDNATAPSNGRRIPPSLPRPGPATARLLVNIVALAVLVVLFTLLSDKFLTPVNVANILRQIAVVVTVGCFFTLLMVAGGIDLSVGGVLAVSGMVSILLVNAGAPLPICLAAAIGVGMVVGTVNGLLVSVIGINTVVATLGTMYVTRGATLVIGGGKSIVSDDPGFAYIGNGTIGPIPVMVIIMAIVLVVTYYLEHDTLLGRYAVFAGSNARGSRMCGLPVRTIQVMLFMLTGAAAGLAGVMASSRVNAALPHAGVGFEFELIIATLLGGTSLFGGQGSVLGLLLGALIVGTATTGMNIIGIPSFVQTVLLGAVLLSAVGLDAAVRTRRERSPHRAAAKEA